MTSAEPGATMDDKDAIAALISDLQWQIDQLGPRGIKDAAGHPYNPSYYKRGLQNAIQRGGLAVADYVRAYLHKPPSGGYKKVEEADSLDLACEALVADESKVYAHLFTDAERARARKRLAPHMAAIEARKAARQARIDAAESDLPRDLDELRARAAAAKDPEAAIAVNAAILRQAPSDVVALNRLGRAYTEIGAFDDARQAFERVIEVDPDNRIAAGRLTELARRAS